MTPFEGRFGMNLVSAGPPGIVALTFHPTRDLEVSDRTPWFGYALVTRDAHAPQPHWTLALLDPGPTRVGRDPPRDFFQNAVDGHGRVRMALQRVEAATKREDVYYIGERVAAPGS